VVIDNGSREPEGERLAREFGEPMMFVRLTANRGVPGGYNAGLRWAHQQGATHVLLMNNDTLVTDPEMVDRLAATAADPAVAAVTPIVLNHDGTVYSAGGWLSWHTGLSGHHHVPYATDRAYEAKWLDGPCLLVSLEAALRIGGLDEVFVTYWEDVDWCVRAVRAGYRCMVEPRTSVIHLRGGTNPSVEAERMSLRNRLLFMRRNGSLRDNVISTVFFILVHIPIFVLRRARGVATLRGAVASVMGALMWNIRDAHARGSWRRPATGSSLGPPP
jgi:GT2 family glycosyltransferase